MKKWILIGFVGALLFGCQGQQQGEEAGEEAAVVEPANLKEQGIAKTKFDERRMPDVLELAESDDRFSTLVNLIHQAGVENAVKNQGPLTVFAPTNDAFKTLPDEVVAKLTDPNNTDKLAYVLTHHVAPANYPVEKLQELAEKGTTLFMASGEYVPVEVKDGEIYVGGAKILESHKVANGWVHVVDKPIVPEKLEL
ncbi:MAG: fasciclin domain-containing protein [Chlorobi bacterium]|nr:fasciclin domain-containing protein [Chlorobiota bacterium]